MVFEWQEKARLWRGWSGWRVDGAGELEVGKDVDKVSMEGVVFLLSVEMAGVGLESMV